MKYTKHKMAMILISALLLASGCGQQESGAENTNQVYTEVTKIPEKTENSQKPGDKNKEEVDLNQGVDDMGGMDMDVSDNFAAPDFTEEDMALGFTFESEDDSLDDDSDFFTAGEAFFADDDDYKED